VKEGGSPKFWKTPYIVEIIVLKPIVYIWPLQIFAPHDVAIWAQFSKKNTILHLPQPPLVKGWNLEFLFGIPTPL
jgi:hypothetical protein